MPKYITYHNQNFTDYFFSKSLKGNHIKKAAVVEADNLDDVYRATNTIDSPWTENPEVKEVLTDSPRSLSVGDLILDEAANKLHVVEDMGFRVVTKAERNSINFIK